MSSKIQKELADMTEEQPSRKRGESETSQEYMQRLAMAVGSLKDDEWSELSKDAQLWYNDAAEAYEKKKDIPIFPDHPDAKKAEEAPARRRKTSEDAAGDKPAASYKPSVGDVVKATTKRGKTYEGKLTELDADEGIVVIDIDGEDEELALKSIESWELVKAKGGKSAAKEEPESAEPEVGDTVQVTTKRGKVIMGNITELTEDDIVLEDAAGEIHDFSRDRVESITVKSKGKASKGSAKKEDADEKPAAKGKKAASDEDGAEPVTVLLRRLVVENPDATQEQISKKAKGEGAEFKEGTLEIAYKDTQRIIKLARTAGKWKIGRAHV
jgi:hypothetical protein